MIVSFKMNMGFIQWMINIVKKIGFLCLVSPFQRLIMGALGRKSYIPLSTRLDGSKRIFVGYGVTIGRQSWLAAMPLTGSKTCRLIIGDGTYVGNQAHFYATSRIEIGHRVLFADKVYVSDNLHTYEDIEMPIIAQPIKQLNEVTIGDGAWIGENACIIGASIGKHCVVGANAVVTKDIPDYCVAVGAPAIIVKRYSHELGTWIRTNEDGSPKDKKQTHDPEN